MMGLKQWAYGPILATTVCPPLRRLESANFLEWLIRIFFNFFFCVFDIISLGESNDYVNDSFVQSIDHAFDCSEMIYILV